MKCAPYYSPALDRSGSFAVGFNGRRPVGFSEAVLISALRWRDRASCEMLPVTAEASQSSCPPGSTPSLLLLGCHRGWVWPWLAAARQRRSALAQAGRISAKNSSCLLLERLPPCRLGSCGWRLSSTGEAGNTGGIWGITPMLVTRSSPSARDQITTESKLTF